MRKIAKWKKISFKDAPTFKCTVQVEWPNEEIKPWPGAKRLLKRMDWFVAQGKLEKQLVVVYRPKGYKPIDPKAIWRKYGQPYGAWFDVEGYEDEMRNEILKNMKLFAGE